MTTPPADWDAGRYHQVARPHAAWGATVLDRLRLTGDERVLDAGCGSGRVTAQLLERLPRGHVIAADQSPAMLAEARKTLATWAAEQRVTFVEADLLDIDHALDQPVDVIFSTAVFHWIADHPRLFAALRGVLRPGGYLVAQCGGAGNLANFMRATDLVAAQAPSRPCCRAAICGASSTRPRKPRRACWRPGFARARAWLEPSPQQFADATALGRILSRGGADQSRLGAARVTARRLRRSGRRRNCQARGRLHPRLRPPQHGRVRRRSPGHLEQPSGRSRPSGQQRGDLFLTWLARQAPSPQEPCQPILSAAHPAHTVPVNLAATASRPQNRIVLSNSPRSSTISLRAAPLGGPPTGAAERGDRDALSGLYGGEPAAVGPDAAHSAGRVPVAWAARVLLATGRSGRDPGRRVDASGRPRSPTRPKQP